MRTAIVTIVLLFFNGVTELPCQENKKFYAETYTDLIFSWSNVSFNKNSDFFNTHPNSKLNSSNVRTTLFFHLSRTWHYNLNNNFGLFTGLGVKNIGISTNEQHNFTGNNNDLEDYKFVRRNYLLGLPLALKTGSFGQSLYTYAGAEIDFSVHYKQKYWHSHQRKGGKTIDKQWFGNQTNRLQPSVFIGVELPKGFHVNLRYYLSDFLNHNYIENTSGINDFTRYANTNIVYFSIRWQLKSEKIVPAKNKQEVIAFL